LTALGSIDQQEDDASPSHFRAQVSDAQTILHANVMVHPKILFVAFACEPGRGSEPGIGWNFVEEASKYRPVWVITDSSYRPGLESFLKSKHTSHPIHPIYVRLPLLKFPMLTYFGNNIYYYLWQFAAARKARMVHANEKFDLVQHVSFERYWMHSAGASVGPTFIFGPVGGGDHWPEGMRDELSWFGQAQSYAWDAVRRLMELDPFLKRTLRKAAAVIPSVEVAKKHLIRLGVEPKEVMIALLPNPNLALPSRVHSDREVFRWISIGRVPRWKGVHLAIKAFAKAFGPESNQSEARVEYVIIGDGPDLRRLKKLAGQLGVKSKIRFLGDLPYAECLQHLANASAMLHLPMRDSAGVVYEALMLGIPVACTDIGLSAAVVDSTCGIVLPTNRGADHLTQSMSEVIQRWTSDPDLLRDLEQGARDKTQTVNREERGKTLEVLYRDLLGSRGSVKDQNPRASAIKP
jgi:glycosyltransferase involved in cell wall biosynthesis